MCERRNDATLMHFCKAVLNELIRWEICGVVEFAGMGRRIFTYLIIFEYPV